MVEANPACEPSLKAVGESYEILALSSNKGFADLYIENVNPLATGASVYKENTDWYSEGKYHTVKVQTDTLDNRDYFSGIQIDLIKIDVQGSELDVLLGGEKTLGRTSHVLMELSLVEYNLGAPSIAKVVDKMVEYGFCMVDFIDYHSFPQLYSGLVFQIDVLFKKLDIY